MNKEEIQVNKLIRLKDVIERTGLARSTIYSKIQDGKFPNSISLGERSVAWIDREISEWIEQKILTSRNS